MKTIETKVYDYSELSDKAKEKAREWAYECACSDEWWESTYEDAERIGLKITSFGLDRNRHAEGDFVLSGIETMNAIFKEHGKECETYKTAQAFDAAIDALPDMPDEDAENYYEVERQICEGMDDAESDFLKSLLEDYSILLQKESEHLSSEEYLQDMIEANEYTFTEDGKRFG